MTTTTSDHVVRAEALRAMMSEATARRAALPMDAPEREFLLGVEAAAHQRLRPEMASVHDEAWLARQHPRFREGYEQALLLVSVPGPSPLRFLLPEP